MTKEEAISIISGYEAYGCGYCLQGGDEVEEALSLAIDALKQEPVRHGHWMVHTDKWASGDEYFGYAECSECGDMFYAVETIGIKPIWDYCPSCGAKMDEVEE